MKSVGVVDDGVETKIIVDYVFWIMAVKNICLWNNDCINFFVFNKEVSDWRVYKSIYNEKNFSLVF